MNAKKVYVNNENKANIICPYCQKGKKISVGQYKGRYSIKVKCSCNKVFQIYLDFRQNYRKKIKIKGKCINLRVIERTIWKNIVVDNLSITGIGFRAIASHGLKKGNEVRIQFHLDNSHKTFIKKDAVVVKVAGKYIGCEIKQNRSYEKALGFYLMV